MIVRLDAQTLRLLADQLDGFKMVDKAEGSFEAPVMFVNGVAMAYLHWWQDREEYMAEITSFVPGESRRLVWHDFPVSQTDVLTEDGLDNQDSVQEHYHPVHPVEIVDRVPKSMRPSKPVTVKVGHWGSATIYPDGKVTVSLSHNLSGV